MRRIELTRRHLLFTTHDVSGRLDHRLSDGCGLIVTDGGWLIVADGAVIDRSGLSVAFQIVAIVVDGSGLVGVDSWCRSIYRDDERSRRRCADGKRIRFAFSWQTLREENNERYHKLRVSTHQIIFDFSITPSVRTQIRGRL